MKKHKSTQSANDALTANYSKAAKSKLENGEFRRNTCLIQHEIHGEFHNFKNESVNASMIVDYNSNLTAHAYRKNNAPKKHELPAITKFEGMDELMTQVTSKNRQRNQGMRRRR